MFRLLVVVAGATIEECSRSGNRPSDPDWRFPSIRDFCRKLFDPASRILLQTTASYLDERGLSYDRKMLNQRPGDLCTADDMAASSVGVFLRLEADNPEEHNIERLSEHVWNTFGMNRTFLDGYIYDGIYLHLFAIFTEQFGLGMGRPMLVSIRKL